MLSGVLGLAAMLASPVAGVFLMLGAVAKLIADGRPAGAPRRGSGCRRWRAGSGCTCCSPRAAPTASRRPRSGRCWSSPPPASRCSPPGGGRCGPAGCCTWACWSARSSCRRRSGRTRCGSACSPARPCSRSRTAGACRVPGARGGRRRPAVPAVAAGRAGRRRGARRPEHAARVPGRGARLPRARGQAGRARRGAADQEPLGGGGSGQGRAARARVGAPARPEGQPDLLRRRGADRRHATTTGCARTPSAGSRCRTRRWTTPRATRRSCSSAAREFLKLVYESPRWRIWEVRGTDPPASDGAKLLAAGPNWFMVDAAKPTVVRYRYTPYWSTTDACVSRAPGGWTRVEPRGRGRRARGRRGSGSSARARPVTRSRPVRLALEAMASRLLPRGAAGSAVADPAVLRRVLGLPARARAGVRPVGGGVRARPPDRRRRARAARVRRARHAGVGDRHRAGSTTSAPGCT